MKTINSFFINKEKKSHHNCVLLKEFIEKFLDDGDLHLSLYEFSKIIDIPLDSIKDKSKQLMLSKFNFKTGKFNSNYSILKIFLNFLIELPTFPPTSKIIGFSFIIFSFRISSKFIKSYFLLTLDTLYPNILIIFLIKFLMIADCFLNYGKS